MSLNMRIFGRDACELPPIPHGKRANTWLCLHPHLTHVQMALWSSLARIRHWLRRSVTSYPSIILACTASGKTYKRLSAIRQETNILQNPLKTFQGGYVSLQALKICIEVNNPLWIPASPQYLQLPKALILILVQNLFKISKRYFYRH